MAVLLSANQYRKGFGCCGFEVWLSFYVREGSLEIVCEKDKEKERKLCMEFEHVLFRECG